MDIKIFPTRLKGTITAIPSKSQAHRLLICAAFADKPTTIICPQTNRDIEATAQCLNALGAEVLPTENGYRITPVRQIPTEAVLPCGESGSTLRFILPIAGALGVNATLEMSGRLPERPLSPLWEEMERMGCKLSRPQPNMITCTGQFKSGVYCIDGSVSSQFISGLLFALSLLNSDSVIQLTGNVQSRPYIKMTQFVMKQFGINTDNLHITGKQKYISMGTVTAEGDWSNGAFFITANALGSHIKIHNLVDNSPQGDKAIISCLKQLSANTVISAADIPDLVPILSVAACQNGCTFTDIQRLRLKESDRVATVMNMLASLGIKSQATESTLTIYPGRIRGGTVDAFNDHRIAMAAAIAATVAENPVVITGAQCVEKSYPSFWSEYAKLGGLYEQYLR